MKFITVKIEALTTSMEELEQFESMGISPDNLETDIIDFNFNPEYIVSYNKGENGNAVIQLINEQAGIEVLMPYKEFDELIKNI